MKTGKLWKALILAGIVGIAGGLAGCGGEKADKGASAAVSSNGKKIVKIAHTAHYFPYDYVDDKNQSDGMEVAVMKKWQRSCRGMNSSMCRHLMMIF